MTNQEQVTAFDRLAKNLKKVADKFDEGSPLFNLFREGEQISADDLHQAAQLADDHRQLAALLDETSRPTKTGEFITLEKAADISQNYIDRFGTGAVSNLTSGVATSAGQRLPLFPDTMWFVNANRLRDITNLKTNDSSAELIRIYPGINIPKSGSEYFTFVFAAEDVHQKLITHDDMDNASKKKMIDEDGHAASALEEIGTCKPCGHLSEIVNQRQQEQQTS